MSMEMIGGWALGTYGKAFLDSAKELIKRKYTDEKEQNERLQAFERRWQNFNWGKSAERYKEHMQEIYGHVRVIGTRVPTPISEIFTDVYILDEPQAYQRFDVMKLHELQKEPENLGSGARERGLSVVVSERGHRLYILGKPGAGKTTFMKYLVHQTIIAGELNKLPIFITLRDWDATNTDILDFIIDQFDVCNFPDAKSFVKYLLQTGRAIVLFDGLDEVPQEDLQRNKTIQALHHFSKKYLETQILITCRIAANNYTFDEFTYIEMADFSDAQVKTYSRNWFIQDPDIAENFLNELNNENNRGIRDLARNPLLLSITVVAYRETGKIPKRRVDLYEEGLDALLKTWDQNRMVTRDEFYKNLSIRKKKDLLAKIAFEYFQNGEIFFTKKQLAQNIEDAINDMLPNQDHSTLDGEDIIKAISAHHGILTERAKDIYSFSHLTFQEYYTSKYIADASTVTTIDELCKHITDVQWQEIFLLTSSLTDDPVSLFSSMQRASQNIIKKDAILSIAQDWSIHQAKKQNTYKQNAHRSFKWFSLINLIIALDHTFSLDLGLSLIFPFDRSRALDRQHEPAVDVAINTRNSALSLSLMLANKSNYDYRHHKHSFIEGGRLLSPPLTLVHAFIFDFAINLAVEQNNKSFTKLTEHTIEVTNELLKEEASYLSDDSNKNYLSLALQLINLVFLTHIFITGAKKKHSKIHVEKIKELIDIVNMTMKTKNLAVSIPPHDAPNNKWEELHKALVDETLNFLDLQTKNINWGFLNLEIFYKYLSANILFWECLQVAIVEDREAIEDMILNAPEGWEMPDDSGAD